MSKRTITCSVLAAIVVGAGTFLHFSDERVAEAPSPATTLPPTQVEEAAAPVVPGDFLYPDTSGSTSTVSAAEKPTSSEGSQTTPPQDSTTEPVGREPVVRGQCHPGGCSGQICTDQPDIVTTCEWREEYACYQSATCERQPSGECGWTETDELRQCLAAGGLPTI